MPESPMTKRDSFIAMIAGLRLDGEDGWQLTDEDAAESMHNLIVLARQLEIERPANAN